MKRVRNLCAWCSPLPSLCHLIGLAIFYRVLDTVIVHIIPGPNIGIMKINKFKAPAAESYRYVVDFLRSKLQLKKEDPLFCYVNAAFCPHPDQILGELHKCFQVGGELKIHYSSIEAWG